MRKLRLRAAVLTLFLLCASGGFFYLGAQAFTTFLPPRTAVVDISKIFNEYQKQIDKSGELKAAIEKTTRLLDTLKEGIAIKEEELKSIKQESPTYVKILSEGLELKRKFRETQKKGQSEIAKQQAGIIKVIRAEIAKESQPQKISTWSLKKPLPLNSSQGRDFIGRSSISPSPNTTSPKKSPIG